MELKALTDVAHFFAIDVSNSVVTCRLASSALTVRPEPALVRRVVTSSLKNPLNTAGMIIYAVDYTPRNFRKFRQEVPTNPPFRWKHSTMFNFMILK